MAAFQADDGYEEPHVIAEIGCNHMGQFEIAKELLTLAKNAGATVGKFQKRCPKELLTEEQYNAQHPNPHNSYGDTYGQHREFLELDVEQHRLLQKHCEEIGLLYSCSVWDTTSAKEIASLNPPLIKVGSPSNQHWEMQKVLRDEYSGMVHISTGMTTKDEVEKIVSFWEQGKGNAKERVILYNCTSGYPVPFQDVCMLELKLLRERFAGRVRGFGFSGHHLGISVDIAAYALGATWNERHFTKDRTWKGTDHAASLEPAGLSKLCRDLKAAWQCMSYKKTDILPSKRRSAPSSSGAATTRTSPRRPPSGFSPSPPVLTTSLRPSLVCLRARGSVVCSGARLPVRSDSRGDSWRASRWCVLLRCSTQARPVLPVASPRGVGYRQGAITRRFNAGGASPNPVPGASASHHCYGPLISTLLKESAAGPADARRSTSTTRRISSPYPSPTQNSEQSAGGSHQGRRGRVVQSLGGDTAVLATAVDPRCAFAVVLRYTSRVARLLHTAVSGDGLYKAVLEPKFDLTLARMASERSLGRLWSGRRSCTCSATTTTRRRTATGATRRASSRRI